MYVRWYATSKEIKCYRVHAYVFLSIRIVCSTVLRILVLLLFSVYIYYIRRHIELITQTYLCTWIPQGIFLILFLLIVFYLRMYVSILKTDITFTSYCTYVRIPHSSQFHNFHDPWSTKEEDERPRAWWKLDWWQQPGLTHHHKRGGQT